MTKEFVLETLNPNAIHPEYIVKLVINGKDMAQQNFYNKRHAEAFLQQMKAQFPNVKANI